MQSRIIFIFISLLFLTAGCRYRLDERLVEIDRLANGNPAEALDSLGTIDRTGLSNADRHYYDLLSIKAADKAYITHSSDSLILDVIDYYSSHKSSGLYPLALYYGGRVYRDLGDYPTALRYFHEALDEISDNDKYLKLRGYIVSQTGALLNQIRLYEQAIPYIEQSLIIDSLTNDTFGLAFDLDLIGAIHMHQGNMDTADSYFNKALDVSYSLDVKDQVTPRVHLAANQYLKGNLDSALTLIRGMPEKSRGLDKSLSLTYASRIYLSAGIKDTAYMYAHQLAYLNGSMNRKTGFQLLLTPELSEMVPLDSLRKYVVEFRSCMDKYLHENESTEALIQNSYYNYSRHVKDKEKIKATKEKIQHILTITIFLVLILIVAVLYLKYRYTRQALKLRDTLNLVSSISQELAQLRSEIPPTHNRSLLPASEDDLRQLLLDRLDYIEQSGVSIPIPEGILTSGLYKTLTEQIEKKKGISDSNPIWKDLENLILKYSPNFKQSLLKLTNGKMSKADIQIAILVRFGISPSGMAILLNLAPSSISSRRNNLSKKIFDRNLGTKAIDYIILSL